MRHRIRIFAVALAMILPTIALDLDESPAEPGNWGYRPTDGSAPAVNPPGFVWRPQPEVSYRLQVADSAAFDNIVYEIETPWSAHCPSTSFEPGQYFWRYAAQSGEEHSAWSRMRSFEITADALENPLPPTSELIARMPKEHPRLFYRPEDIPYFQALAEGRLAEQWASVKSAAEALLENPPDTTEPPLYPPGMTDRDGEWKKIWWGNRTYTIAVLNGSATLAFAYRLSGDERYGEAARDLLMAFAEWDPDGATNYRYNDEAAMPALYYSSRAYDWVYPLLSEDERAKIINVMRARGTDCYEYLREKKHLWHSYDSHRNRAWHFLGEIAIAFHGEIPEADEWLDYVMTILYCNYPVWSDSDGGWHEGMAYWASYLGRFLYWSSIVNSAFDIDVFERPYFKRAGDFPMYLMPSGTRTGGFGDQAILMSSERVADLVAAFAAGARNPYWQWYAEQGKGTLGGGYLGFLYAEQSKGFEAKAPEELPASKLFRGTGVAALNTNLLDGTKNVQVIFKSDPTGKQSHGYNANNAFLLNVHGYPVFVRSGKRDVSGSPHHRQWMWETKSDNAILVNGQGQIPHNWEATGEILDFYTSDTLDMVSGEARESYTNLDHWVRTIVFVKPDVIVIHDRLIASEPSTFQFLLHAPGKFDIRNDHEVVWQGEPGEVTVRFFEPEALAVTQTDQYTPPPAEWTNWDLGEWHLTADAAEATKVRDFLTAIMVNRPGLPRYSKTSDGESLIELDAGNEPVVIRIAGDALFVHRGGSKQSISLPTE